MISSRQSAGDAYDCCRLGRSTRFTEEARSALTCCCWKVELMAFSFGHRAMLDGAAVTAHPSMIFLGRFIDEERMNVVGPVIRARGGPHFHPASVWEAALLQCVAAVQFASRMHCGDAARQLWATRRIYPSAWLLVHFRECSGWHASCNTTCEPSGRACKQDRSALAPAHVVTVKKPTVVPPPRPWAFPFWHPPEWGRSRIGVGWSAEPAPFHTRERIRVPYRFAWWAGGDGRYAIQSLTSYATPCRVST